MPMKPASLPLCNSLTSSLLKSPSSPLSWPPVKALSSLRFPPLKPNSQPQKIPLKETKNIYLQNLKKALPHPTCSWPATGNRICSSTTASADSLLFPCLSLIGSFNSTSWIHSSLSWGSTWLSKEPSTWQRKWQKNDNEPFWGSRMWYNFYFKY